MAAALSSVIKRTISLTVSEERKEDRVCHVTQLTHTNVRAKKETIFVISFQFSRTSVYLTLTGFESWRKSQALLFLMFSILNIHFHHLKISLHIQIFILYGNEARKQEEKL